MKIVFVHGWGFSPEFWLPVIKNLTYCDCITVDLGYWGNTKTAINTLPDQAIYIGHSLGLLWILKNIPQKVSGLVSINGFDCFYRHTPQIILDKMKSELQKDPERQLIAFYRQCGQKNLKIPNTLAVPVLLEGLNLLSDFDLRDQKETLTSPVLILASQNDRIVSQAMTNNIWHGQNVIWSKTGGHALPLTQSQWCSAHILDFKRKL